MTSTAEAAFCETLALYGEEVQEDIDSNQDPFELIDAVQQTSRDAADILERDASEMSGEAAFDAAELVDLFSSIGTESDPVELTDQIKGLPEKASEFSNAYC